MPAPSVPASMSPYQNIIHLTRYARQNKRAGRRETWAETVQRYIDCMLAQLLEFNNLQVPIEVRERVEQEILSMGSMPSMRALMAAGRMLEYENATTYNCCYVPIDHPYAFDEMLYLLMCTCGVGFSVERQMVGKLPMVPMKLKPHPDAHISVPDNRMGWASSLRRLIRYLYNGTVPTWDTKKVRPKGAPLKTTGGHASGPEPLEQLFRFVVQKFEESKGRRLSSLDCHDIACHIGDIVLVGDVRQAALISLSNLSDNRLRFAKSGDWGRNTPYRAMSNNSVAYTETPTPGAFMGEWLALYDSKSGERGFFNRIAAVDKCQSIGRATTWLNGQDIEFGPNPCGEIVLRPMQMCNLSEVVARAGDDEADLKRKVEVAAILGTWQSTLTRFRYLRKNWKRNCEEERLLGVSITGIMDCDMLNQRATCGWLPELLQELRAHARETNRTWADMLGIPRSAAITTIKPSGTVSQLVDAASGIHARYAPFYLRRINVHNAEPLNGFMRREGFMHEPHLRKPETHTVFVFPMRAPEGSVVEGQRSAIENLEHWRVFREHWCDHNASITVQVSEAEWPVVGAWVWQHFDQMGGVTFAPQDMGSYKQTPYERISEDAYKDFIARQPGQDVDFTEVGMSLSPNPRQELACAAGACELVDV